MKKYNELTTEQKDKAVEKALEELLKTICVGGLRFSDELNNDDLQARIDNAADEMEKNQTPWFLCERIMETCREDLEGIARATAEEAFYPEKGEGVLFIEE